MSTVNPITSVYTLACLMTGDILIHTDRGNGCGGPGYENTLDIMTEIDSGERTDEAIQEVRRDEDPEAWSLALDAMDAVGADPETLSRVFVGVCAPGCNSHQMIYLA